MTIGAATTYAFSDGTIMLSHPGVGSYAIMGEGTGSIAFAMANDVTVHDTAADGHVMVSKITSSSGTVTLEVQQTSPLNAFLMRWYNYVTAAPTEEWIGMSVQARFPSMGESYEATGVSPQKLADRNYAAEGQRVTWVLMAADIQHQAA